jgi:hypothetical protein
MNTLKIKFVGHQTISYPVLSVSVMIDNINYILDPLQTEHEFVISYDKDQVTEHQFAIVIDGKQNYLEQLYQGKIFDDIPNLSYVIDQLLIDDHDIIPILLTRAKYYHNTNGETDSKIEEYTNWLGYDGRLQFRFLTPLFTWFIADYEF